MTTIQRLTIAAAASIFLVALLAGCADRQQREAEQWLERATTLYAQERYTDALDALDSLRSRCPEAIEARRKAMTMRQDIELGLAQHEIETIDRRLAEATALYETMKAAADSCHDAGTATAAQLTAVTRQMLLRDSLRAAFEIQCAKVKHIHKKMTKTEPEK